MKTLIALIVASFALSFHVASANQHGGTEVAKKTKMKKKMKKAPAAHEEHGSTDAAPAAGEPAPTN